MWNVMMMIVPLSMSMAAKNLIPLDLSYDRGPLRWRKSTILVAISPRPSTLPISSTPLE
jgi:hypothetical protein